MTSYNPVFVADFSNNIFTINGRTFAYTDQFQQDNSVLPNNYGALQASRSGLVCGVITDGVPSPTAQSLPALTPASVAAITSIIGKNWACIVEWTEAWPTGEHSGTIYPMDLIGSNSGGSSQIVLEQNVRVITPSTSGVTIGGQSSSNFNAVYQGNNQAIFGVDTTSGLLEVSINGAALQTIGETPLITAVTSGVFYSPSFYSQGDPIQPASYLIYLSFLTDVPPSMWPALSTPGARPVSGPAAGETQPLAVPVPIPMPSVPCCSVGACLC